MTSPIIQQDFNLISEAAKTDYQDQKHLVLTLLVTGILLIIGSAIAIYYTHGVFRGTPVFFGFLLGAGLVTAVGPLRGRDWHNYSSHTFFNEVHQRFREYDEESEQGAFRDFIQYYDFKKLGDYGYTKEPLTAQCYSTCLLHVQKGGEYHHRLAIREWNKLFLKKG